VDGGAAGRGFGDVVADIVAHGRPEARKTWVRQGGMAARCAGS
jgi:hypothetical protein